MASLNLYDAYIPYIFQSLDALDAILNKGESHAKEKDIDFNAEYVGARIYEDMGPLAFQVQTVTDIVHYFVLPLVDGTPVDTLPREEKTFDELRARLEWARKELKTLGAESVNARADEVLNFKFRAMPVRQMLVAALVPNTFFHVATAYDILRMKGVPLGKFDFLGSYFTPKTE